MGLTFKENCPDMRNTRVVDIIDELKEYNCTVDVYDPWVTVEEAQARYNIVTVEKLRPKTYDGIILAVAHRQFKKMEPAFIRSLGKAVHVLYDLKYIFSKDQSDIRL